MQKKRLLATAVAAALSTGMIAWGASPIFAGETTAKAVETSAKAKEQDFVKVSEDALMSMRNVNSARLAIFNGMPDQAETFVDAAATRIAATVQDADKYALDTKAPKAEDRYVPFDASLTIVDTEELTPEKTKHISKANEHLRKGEKQQALEALKNGEIDVGVTTNLVPVSFAKEHIDEASKLIGEGKYYEANLALKAVDDAAVVETYGIDAVPKVKAKT